MQIFGLFVTLLLVGCAVGEAGRWISAENKTVSVEGIPYGVSWVRDSTAIDMRGTRAQVVVLMPDEIIERRRNTEAALIVATDLCGRKAIVITEAKSGDLYTTRVKCG